MNEFRSKNSRTNLSPGACGLYFGQVRVIGMTSLWVVGYASAEIYACGFDLVGVFEVAFWLAPLRPRRPRAPHALRGLDLRVLVLELVEIFLRHSLDLNAFLPLHNVHANAEEEEMFIAHSLSPTNAT
ncbi:hypothetical protein ACQVP2_31900 [Methylobacterium aquaticum]|uniref:hypothetical protein n=1 Tax=Methylobacterium aquaticum TaxID=270351 RepID=UPI003D183EAF